MLERVKQDFLALAKTEGYCSLRYLETRRETLAVRKDVVQPWTSSLDRGAMLTVVDGDGQGYASTSDLSREGLARALDRARAWARAMRGRTVHDFGARSPEHPIGEYHGPAVGSSEPWNAKDILDLLRAESANCRIDPRIVDWFTSAEQLRVHQLFITNGGGHLEQRFAYLIPSLRVTAFADGDVQTRSLGGQNNGYCQQGGIEILSQSRFYGAGRRVAEEALALLRAVNCPAGDRDLLLMPEQMMLQIHESIGHPLELDRILGDERNYAGTSFVTREMFGHYQYGSRLLNITHDPTRREEFASYGWDDDGTVSDKTWLIREGILLRPLGGRLSQARANLPGVANSRAGSWNRPPIDRMANLNMEPGTNSLADLLSMVERGVLMNTNVSWSIDDSRNKFQFGCEWGQLIENGKLAQLVKNPGYRGTSATFWRSLKAVGNADTVEVMGVPDCGKGEPNQVIRVGHAAPACLFERVEVFGGES